MAAATRLWQKLGIRWLARHGHVGIDHTTIAGTTKQEGWILVWLRAYIEEG